MQQLARACHRLARKPRGQFRRKTRRDTSAGKLFGKQEDVSRARARHGGDGVHQRFVIYPFDAAGRAQQCIGDIALLLADACRGNRDGDPTSDGRRGVRHRPHHLATAGLR
ncbi:hypothetical protein BN961_02730 [Afipia felis]|uniref:Uncharacterized protein n=1 Tax=Afipia felis TaxID=1035 RepID=A0A090MPK7_AFIFE|nr:hypothetical protein BN961_02730 [Afipia felis]